MNILHMKYAVEVAKSGSVNKASEALLIAQPNLSRSIKELEADLGITIFDRTTKGMTLTPDGETFIGYAKAILTQIDSIENLYKTGLPIKQRFSVSVPRASYIAEAFISFTQTLSRDSIDILYKETNSARTIKNIQNSEYKLGIIRYASNYERFFKEMLDEKNIAYEPIAEFKYKLIASKKSPLLKDKVVHYEDLKPFIEIIHGDPFVPFLPIAQIRKEELPDDVPRRISVFERSIQFELLSSNPETYMWVSPVPQHMLDTFNLEQFECPDNNKIYRDMLIYDKNYKMTDLDKRFVAAVKFSKSKILN